MNDTVYTPEVIPDTPFPGESPTSQTVSQPVSNETYSQVVTPVREFPVKRIATEVLSESLNTKSRKILAIYGFTKSGAIQIGEYQPGVSGDLRITPDGITARNQAGETTFAIDGDTGDATFKGTIQAKDFVIADENGLISAANFQTDSYTASDTISLGTGFSSTDVAGSTLNLTLVRPARVLICFFANVTMTPIDGLREYHIDVWIDADGVNITGNATFSTQGVANSSNGITLGSCLSFSRVMLLSEGQHTLKMRWDAFADNTVTLRKRGFDYCMLGS